MCQQRTLQDWIKLFNYSEVCMRSYAVKGMESLSEWDTAAIYWDKLGRDYAKDAEACRMIQEANHQGDAYRESVKELVEWVDETVESGIMTQDEALRVVYPKMQEEHKKHVVGIF